MSTPRTPTQKRKRIQHRCSLNWRRLTAVLVITATALTTAAWLGSLFRYFGRAGTSLCFSFERGVVTILAGTEVGISATDYFCEPVREESEYDPLALRVATNVRAGIRWPTFELGRRQDHGFHHLFAEIPLW